MKQKKELPRMAQGEYVLPGASDQTAAARWEFSQAVRRVLPRFFTRLRARIYPEYARLAAEQHGYWKPGWTFETWCLHSDRENRLAPLLRAWAAAFHAEEEWILEGALQTLWLWHEHPAWRAALDISGFRTFPAGETLLNDDERRFRFEDPGWDPQWERWSDYCASLVGRWKSAVARYEKEMRALVASRGAVPARKRFSSRNFEWFVLYQLGGISSVRILARYDDVEGDESTVLKGVKVAAALLQWGHLRQPAATGKSTGNPSSLRIQREML